MHCCDREGDVVDVNVMSKAVEKPQLDCNSARLGMKVVVKRTVVSGSATAPSRFLL
jgi:hypothetical protein